MQGFQNRPAGDQKIHRRREADFFGGVLLDGARDFHHVGDRLYRGVESKVFGLLHLARVNIDIAEAAFFVGTPILAVAKNGHEIAEGDDLVIGRAVVELARVVFHRLGKVDFADLFAVEQKLGLTVHRVDDVRRIGIERGLNAHRSQPVHAAANRKPLGNLAVFFALHVLHRHEIVGKQPVGFHQRLGSEFERSVGEPVADAQQIVLQDNFSRQIAIARKIIFELTQGSRTCRLCDCFHLNDFLSAKGSFSSRLTETAIGSTMQISCLSSTTHLMEGLGVCQYVES